MACADGWVNELVWILHMYYTYTYSILSMYTYVLYLYLQYIIRICIIYILYSIYICAISNSIRDVIMTLVCPQRSGSEADRE